MKGPARVRCSNDGAIGLICGRMDPQGTGQPEVVTKWGTARGGGGG